MAGKKVKLKGMNKVMKNLNKEIQKIGGRCMKGLLLASIHVRRDMEKTPPLIPIDTGNLRASWFSNSFYEGGNPVVRLGFSASYAIFVHENVGATFQRPGSGAKFFESALKRNTETILQIIRDNAEIPK